MAQIYYIATEVDEFEDKRYWLINKCTCKVHKWNSINIEPLILPWVPCCGSGCWWEFQHDYIILYGIWIMSNITVVSVFSNINALLIKDVFNCNKVTKALWSNKIIIKNKFTAIVCCSLNWLSWIHWYNFLH